MSTDTHSESLRALQDAIYGDTVRRARSDDSGGAKLWMPGSRAA